MLGVGITNFLIWVRSKVNPDTTMETSQAQNPLIVSSAYATYMATSSNLRYQVLAGVLEERGVEVWSRMHILSVTVPRYVVCLCCDM